MLYLKTDKYVIYVIDHYPHERIAIDGGRVVMRGFCKSWVKFDLT